MSVIAPVKPYFKYAMDLQQSMPVVAYYCKLYGVTKGMDILRKVGSENKEVKDFLMKELADLERMKGGLEGTTKDDQKV